MKDQKVSDAQGSVNRAAPALLIHFEEEGGAIHFSCPRTTAWCAITNR